MHCKRVLGRSHPTEAVLPGPADGADGVADVGPDARPVELHRAHTENGGDGRLERRLLGELAVQKH